MKHLVSLTAVLLLAVCQGCGGDSPESLTVDSMATMKEMIATLDTVKDQASAKAAKPKLTALVQQMNKLKERQSKLPEPSEAEMKSMLEKHGREMGELQEQLATVMMRIQFDSAIQAELSDIDMNAME